MKETTDYIFIKREIVDEDGFINSTERKIEMSRFADKIAAFLMPELKKMQNNIEALSEKLNDLENSVMESAKQADVYKLSKGISTLKSELSTLKSTIEPMHKKFNSDMAQDSIAYTKGINALATLNDDLKSGMSSFSRHQELNMLQSLVEYLYSNDSNARMSLDLIKQKVVTSDFGTLLDKITKFNETHRMNLLTGIEKFGQTWEQCVVFPRENNFDTAECLNQFVSGVTSETPIFVVRLGLNFPKSNFEEVKPGFVYAVQNETSGGRKPRTLSSESKPTLNDKNNDNLNRNHSTSDIEYTNAVNELIEINKIFSSNAINFVNNSELKILKSLIQYVYNGDKEVPKDLLHTSRCYSLELTELLRRIQNFNQNKRYIIEYRLNAEKTSWEKCVICTIDDSYNPHALTVVGECKLPNNNDFEIVSLGLAFPNQKTIQPSIIQKKRNGFNRYSMR